MSNTLEPIATENAPAAIGPYSQAIRTGNLLFVSGQLPVDPATGNFAGETAAEQAKQSLKNLAAIAEKAGTSLAKAVKVTVFITDIAEFAAVNEVYGQIFAAPFPARSCFEVSALPKGAKIEIEAIIAID